MTRRIARLAAAQDRSPHAFMLEALKEKIEADEAERAFVAEAERRLQRMKRTGKAVPAGEAFAWLEQRAQRTKASRPTARRSPGP